MDVVKALMLFLAVMGSSCTFLAPPPFDEARWRRQVESAVPEGLYALHDRDGRFFNPWTEVPHGGFIRLLRWRLTPGDPYTPEEESFQPAFIPELRARIEAMPNGDFVAWLGHGSFLLRLGGDYWLLDPMLSERALLPRRLTPPALTLEELRGLPGVLHVILSHNHYDHLDKATLQALPAGARRIYAPLGLAGLIRDYTGIQPVEMDWWQTVDAGNGIRIVCLPAQHWSRRIGQGRNKSLWASFLIITPERTVYFGGDSGYFIGYREIGRRYPGIDLALLPLTAYHPRWFMHYAHMNAPEVLDAFEDLGARTMIPTQWGAFRLGNEPIGYPILDLKRVTAARSIDASSVIIMDIGQLHPLGDVVDKVD
ncbi:MAG: MBL fold metallo-hydrolase [Syntrophobacteraceae bacterium]|jgi:L-ascorbate metabolism protein UlaG (beta-lactamase superfamily)|nr:MBL fold metallo-hydrolase [Syntrophobacteraceae bacterium]